MAQKPNDIFKDNAFEYEFSVQEKDGVSGKWIPSTGLVNLSIWISATDGGAEIAAALKVAATERAQKLGTYYGRIPGATITANLFPVADGSDFFVVGGDLARDIKVSSPRKAYNVKRV